MDTSAPCTCGTWRSCARPLPAGSTITTSPAFTTSAMRRGAAPIRPGDPGWEQKFDGDGDGVGCDS